MPTINSLPQGTIIHGEHQQYILERVLGSGSFGITYYAQTSERDIDGSVINYEVAVKEFFMHDTCSRDNTGQLTDISDKSITAKYKHSFEREARNLSKFRSSSIVRVREIIEQNNTYYIVMEYVAGQTLDNYINSQPDGHLNEQEALRITREVAQGLHIMHAANMRHLDMKPVNVMLDEMLHPHIIDFGLSRQLDNNGEMESSTTIGLGTKGYAPIEQLDSDNTAPKATIDIYALGGTLFKMLTGKSPIGASQLMWGFPTRLFEPLQNAGVSNNVSELVCQMMQPNDQERIQSIDRKSVV